MSQIHNKKTVYNIRSADSGNYCNFLTLHCVHYFFRVDLTKENVYSLSNSSKTVIKKLDDRMIAKVFYSDNLPGQYANSRRYLQDLLEEYQAYSKGHFHFEFINPDEDEDAAREAQSYQIPPIQLQVIEKRQTGGEKKCTWVWCFCIMTKKKTLPVIQNTTGVEYDLTAAIKKLTASGMNTIGIYSGGEGIVTDNLKQVLQQTYNVPLSEHIQ